MTNNQIIKILNAYSIPYYEKDGRIFADSMLSGTSRFEEVEDFTGCTKKQLYEWLGY